MISLTTPPECEDTDELCKTVVDVTGSEWLGAAADWLIAKPFVILVILLLGLLARWLVNKLIDRVVDRASGGVLPNGVIRGRARQDEMERATLLAAERRRQRAETMGTVLKSIAAIAIFAVVTIMALSELSLDVGPLLASAGIVGLAIGFGAQTLVKDFLSGIFMFFEDQYGVGDVVDLGDATGTVEAVTLRVTRLRDVNGTVWYVRNGEILRVGNMSQNWARTVLDVSVGYGEDLAQVRRILTETCNEVWHSEAFAGKIIEEPEVWGVERMDPDGLAVRVAVKTAPLEQWAVARELRARIKESFEAEGIEIPFPQRVVWHRDEPQTDPATARD